VDPHNDSLQSVADYLVQFAEQFFQLTPIRCRFDVPTNLPDQVFRPNSGTISCWP